MKKVGDISLNRAYLRMWWFPGLVGLIVLVGSFAVLLPQINNFKEKYGLLKTTRQSLAKAETKLDQVVQLDTERTTALYRLSTQALPKHKPYYEVLMSIQQLAVETGVRVGDFDLDPGSLATKSATRQENGYTTLSTTLHINGTTPQVTAFVDRLHQSLPLVGVTKISISTLSKKEMETADQRQASLEIDIYYSSEIAAKKADFSTPLSTITKEMEAAAETLAHYTVMGTNTASGSAVSNFGRTDLFSF